MKINNTEFVDTVVIGGGQAGLAIGTELARQGRDFVILDAGLRVGDAWRLRWDSLRLFTPARFDGLPGMPFPGDPLSYPAKDDVASYLEAYAMTFALPIRSGVRVDRVWREGERFVASAGGLRWESHNVVVATGGCQAPKVPDFADGLDEHIVQLHSSDYLNPSQLPPGPVLVVGVGNSGAEIARDVAPTRPTWIAGTPIAEIPGRPSRATARFVFPLVRFAEIHVLTIRNPIGRAAAAQFHGAPLIRTKVADLVADGVRVVPRITGAQDGRPAFADGTTCEVSSVIWCTGYRNDFAWIDLSAFDDDGEPLQRRGVVESVPGLYFLGLEFLYAFASATIPGIGRDARYLARRMRPPAPVRTVQPSQTVQPEWMR
jgi:putative flavoprotein involved in K+ transport